MPRYRYTIKINDSLTDTLDFHINNTEELPSNDTILNEYSMHYHKATKRALPPTAQVLSVEEIGLSEGEIAYEARVAQG